MMLDSQLIRQQAILKEVLGGVSRSTLDRLIKRGKFPKPMKMGRLNVWKSSDVQAWLDAQKSGAV